MEEKKIEIITKNSDGLYNKVTVHKLEDGSLSKTGDEIAEILLEGDKDSIDTSDFIELVKYLLIFPKNMKILIL